LVQYEREGAPVVQDHFVAPFSSDIGIAGNRVTGRFLALLTLAVLPLCIPLALAKEVPSRINEQVKF